MATHQAVEALRADREALLEICESLSHDDWKAPSGCEGWSVQDVVTHMGVLFWAIVDRSQLATDNDLAGEAGQEAEVAARRSWSPERILDDYRQVSTDALAQLTGFGDVHTDTPLGELGTYPLSFLANAYAFDHYTHIRADLFAPRGPIAGEPPPTDELRLTPTLDWIEAALPQQCAKVLERLRGRVDLVISGEVNRTLQIGSGDLVASVESAPLPFVRWITQRGAWDELGVHATGDETSLDIVRSFRVF